MGDVGVRDAADRVVAVVRDAGRDEYTVRKYQVMLDRFAAFLTARGVHTASELVCIDFIANQTGVRLAALHEPVKDRDVQAVRRPVLFNGGGAGWPGGRRGPPGDPGEGRVS